MSLPELMEYVKAGGGVLAPVFAILWWMERGERQDTQAELKQVADKSTVAMTELKVLIDHLYTIFGNKNGNGQ